MGLNKMQKKPMDHLQVGVRLDTSHSQPKALRVNRKTGPASGSQGACWKPGIAALRDIYINFMSSMYIIHMSIEWKRLVLKSFDEGHNEKTSIDQ